MPSLLWCIGRGCCENLYLAEGPGGLWCPISGVEVTVALTEHQWQVWSDPRRMLSLFDGQERKRALLAEVSRRAGLESLLQMSAVGAPPEQRKHLCDLIRDLLGYPCRRHGFSPLWLARHAATVGALARAIYDEECFTDMPILADALEEAGCTNPHILKHCRGPGPHVRGCWVVDLLLGKA
jgi:hypothetical protein